MLTRSAPVQDVERRNARDLARLSICDRQRDPTSHQHPCSIVTPNMLSFNPMSSAGKAPSRRRELSSGHLALFAIAAMTGTRPIAQAAHAGPASVSLWILAIAGVLLPLSVSCAALTERYPVSGGLYQWARNEF